MRPFNATHRPLQLTVKSQIGPTIPSFGWTPGPEINKFHHQFNKKLYGVRYFESYSRAMFMDSETVALRNFSVARLFATRAANPVAYVKRVTIGPKQPIAVHCNALFHFKDSVVINRSRVIPEWTDHSWFVDREAVVDMFDHIEAATGLPFYNASVLAFAEHFRCFEYNVYQQFVLASPKHRHRLRPVFFNELFASSMAATNFTSTRVPHGSTRMPPLEFSTTWLGSNVTADEEVRMLDGYTRFIKASSMLVFRVPNPIALGRLDYCRGCLGVGLPSNAGLLYYGRLIDLMERCPSLIFSACTGQWRGGQVGIPLKAPRAFVRR